MHEHKWLLDAVDDLRSYAEDQGIPGLVEGLQNVLVQYAQEVAMDDEARLRLFEQLTIETPLEH